MWETKNALFWSPNRESQREEERRRGRRGRSQKVWKLRVFVWMLDFCMEIMDSSMILVHELLGYGLLGFYLDINLVPLSWVLLGRHPNSRFKGSLVEKP